jgi:hypothetical protein
MWNEKKLMVQMQFVFKRTWLWDPQNFKLINMILVNLSFFKYVIFCLQTTFTNSKGKDIDFFLKHFNGFVFGIHITLLESHYFKIPYKKLKWQICFHSLQNFLKFECFSFPMPKWHTHMTQVCHYIKFCNICNFLLWIPFPLMQCEPKWQNYWNVK